jgi:hypothetical protein
MKEFTVERACLDRASLPPSNLQQGGVGMPSSHLVVITAPPTLCACGHALAAHDVISTRYCAATTAHQLSRGCICK